MAGFTLTKEYILASFAPLGETQDLAARAVFFDTTVAADVSWTMAGSAHSLAGTRHSVKAHAAASFGRLGKRLVAPIKFSVRHVVVDAEPQADGSWWACVETRGEALRKSGLRYDNEYLWLTRWNEDGKIVEVRSYFDTMLAEQVLKEPVLGEE